MKYVPESSKTAWKIYLRHFVFSCCKICNEMEHKSLDKSQQLVHHDVYIREMKK